MVHKSDRTWASSALADLLCPGRFRAQQGQPKVKVDESFTRIHLFLSGQPVTLNANEKERAGRLKHKLTDFCETYFQEISSIKTELKMEYSFDGLPHVGIADVIVEGKCDGKKLVFIGDYKSGFGAPPDSHSSINMQLRDLSVLYRRTKNYDGDILVSLIQLHTKPKPCRYTPMDLEEAERQLKIRLKKSYDPNSPRIPSPEACQYCLAKRVCPEFLGILNYLSENLYVERR
jgi:hypothetical protein